MHITKGRKRSRGQKDAREKHSLQLWIISYKHCPWHGYGYLKEARSRIHYRELISAAVGELRERFREEGPNLGASDPPECSVSSHHTRRARRCEESRLCVPRRCRTARAGPGHGSAAAPQMALAPAPLSRRCPGSNRCAGNPDGLRAQRLPFRWLLETRCFW